MRKFLISALAIILLSLSSTAFCSDEIKALEENELLKTELQLAKNPTLYFIFNFKDKKIYLKSRGILLREWKMDKASFWGNPFSLKTIKLLKKTTLVPPERKVIKPGDDSAGIEALELPDMPQTYTLFMEDGMSISVRSKPPEEWKPKLYNFRYTLQEYITHPLLTVWYKYKKQPFVAVDILFEDKIEAQALYWSFTDGTTAILVNY